MRNCSCSSVASDADGPGDHPGDLREESHAVAAARRKHEKRVEAKAKEDLAAASGLPAPSSPSPLHHSNAASPSKMTVEEAKAARDNLRFWEVHARKQLRRARMHERSFVEARNATHLARRNSPHHDFLRAMIPDGEEARQRILRRDAPQSDVKASPERQRIRVSL